MPTRRRPRASSSSRRARHPRRPHLPRASQVTGTVSEFVPERRPAGAAVDAAHRADGHADRTGRTAASDRDVPLAHVPRSRRPVRSARASRAHARQRHLAHGHRTERGQRRREQCDRHEQRPLPRRRHRRRPSVPRSRHPGAGSGSEREHPADSALGLQSRAPPHRERNARRSVGAHRAIGRRRRPSCRSARLQQPRLCDLLLDGTGTPLVTPGTLATTVSSPAGNEITVASVNLRRFFDTIDDAYADAVPSAAAYDSGSPRPRSPSARTCAAPTSSACRRSRRSAVLTDLAARILRTADRTTARTLWRGTTRPAWTSASW